MKIQSTELCPTFPEKVVIAFRIHKVDIVKIPTGCGTFLEEAIVHASIPSATNDSDDIVFKVHLKGRNPEEWVRDTLFMSLNPENIERTISKANY